MTTMNQDPSFQALSLRAQQLLRNEFMVNVHTLFLPVQKNSYHPIDNPQGIANLGIAENKLCIDLVADRMRKVESDPKDMSTFSYVDNTGISSFRSVLSGFFNKMLKPVTEIHKDQIVVTTSATCSIEHIAFVLGDVEDHILVPAPVYYRISNDMYERARVNALHVPLAGQCSVTGTYRTMNMPALTEAQLEAAYQEALKQGKRVKGVLLVNPNNPTGEVYTASQLDQVLQFAHRHDLHVVSNEVYAFSDFDPEVNFTSILSRKLPDPDRVHVIYGFSKLLGTSGHRCGVVLSANKSVLQYLSQTSHYTQLPYLLQRRISAVIEDDGWMCQVFLPTLHEHMRKRYAEVIEVLASFQVRLYRSCAAIFAWMDLSQFLPSSNMEGENSLLQEFLQDGLFIVPGHMFACPEPGWFRLVFTLDEDVHREGLKRLATTLKRLQSSTQK